MITLVKRFDCVFVRVPKVASTSLIHGLFGEIHRNTCDIRTGEFPEEWKDKFSFAFVRNPFDRLVSAWMMLKNWQLVTVLDRPHRDALTLSRCLEIAADESIPLFGSGYLSLCRQHLLPMSDARFYLDRMKFIGRFENLQADYDAVRAELKLQPASLPLFRKTEHEHYSTYFDDILRAEAEAVLAKDLSQFGYEFEVER